MSIENIEKLFSKMDLMDRSKPEPPSLSDMPNDIIDKICGKLDFMDRLVVRKVSRYLRDMIDKRNPEIDLLSVVFYSNSSRLPYDSGITRVVMYSQKNDKCLVESWWGQNVIERGNHIKSLINDLAIVMKNSKLRLKVLDITLDRHLDQSSLEKYSKHLKSFFESLNHQIHTKDVTVFSSFVDAPMSILPFLKPGTLENILFLSHNNYHQAMGEIVKLEQWKQAKTFRMSFENSFPEPLDHFFHFNDFIIKLQSISLQDVIEIRDLLLKSPNFEYGKIFSHGDYNCNVMKRIFKSGIPCNPNGSINYKVPDSDNVFQVLICSVYIEFKRNSL